jgi:hypothetical protein
VTLNKVAEGELTPIGNAQEFRVVPLPSGKPAQTDAAGTQ